MDSDELYISFLFPPHNFVSGITVFKRIFNNNAKVDVLQSNFKSKELSKFNKYVDSYIANRIIVDMDCKNDWTLCIFKFIEKGMAAIKKNYGKIYSRSWLMANHFLASEYKFRHPNVFWTAEFSDPLIYDLSNKPKTYVEMLIDDDEYISRINEQIHVYNKNNDASYPLVENNDSAYFICEYLVYLFSDKIIFTNENQREIMLNQFPVDVKELVLNKSEIEMHPTLDNEFYQINDVNLDLDNNYINMAYFGNDYYSKRHFESLFFSVESLIHKNKGKIRIDLYISNGNALKKLIPSDNFNIKKPLNYLDFLNAATKYDVLIVNDVLTSDSFESNPYLPSKLSDYLGSKSDIWALYEPGSSLSKFDLKYKSNINNYSECRDMMIKILDDYGFGDDDCSFNDDYLPQRLTVLNEVYDEEYMKKRKLQRQVNKLKNENNEMKSSNSWKITKPLRKLKNG